MFKTRFLSMLILSLTFLSCDGDEDKNDNLYRRQTQIKGFAPLHQEGTVYVFALDGNTTQEGSGQVYASGEILESAPIQADGSFSLELKQASGNLAAKAEGGTYQDPLTDSTISMREYPMHAILHGVQAHSASEIMISPWSELLFRFSQKSPGKDAHSIRYASSPIFCPNFQYL